MNIYSKVNGFIRLFCIFIYQKPNIREQFPYKNQKVVNWFLKIFIVILVLKYDYKERTCRR